MGVKVLIDGYEHQVVDYSIQEAISPLAGGDTSGQVGTITLTLKKPDPIFGHRSPYASILGLQTLIGKEVELEDSQKGFILGEVSNVEVSKTLASFAVTCETRLGKLNIYNVSMPPFAGNVQTLIMNYLAVAGVTAGVFVHPSIASKYIAVQGWEGELWLNLKNFAAAFDFEIALVSGVITVRPVRGSEVSLGRAISGSHQVGGPKAQFVEVWNYNTQAIVDEPIYPVNGWSEDVPVITVNAGEYIEEVIELGASVSYIEQPTFQTFVGKGETFSSVYTVSGDDGFPITQAAWVNAGGRLDVVINDDTVTATVRIQAPSKPIPNSNGSTIESFGLALSADGSTGRYSTLRLVGTGVAFSKDLIRIPTGLTPQETGTEVGITVDNAFVGDLDTAYRVGVRAVNQHTGYTITSQATLATEGADFGSLVGGRAWDRDTRRFYRVREASITPGVVDVTMDDDYTVGDFDSAWTGRTVAEFDDQFTGISLQDWYLTGLGVPNV